VPLSSELSWFARCSRWCVPWHARASGSQWRLSPMRPWTQATRSQGAAFVAPAERLPTMATAQGAICYLPDSRTCTACYACGDALSMALFLTRCASLVSIAWPRARSPRTFISNGHTITRTRMTRCSTPKLVRIAALCDWLANKCPLVQPSPGALRQKPAPLAPGPVLGRTCARASLPTCSIARKCCSGTSGHTTASASALDRECVLCTCVDRRCTHPSMCSSGVQPRSMPIMIRNMYAEVPYMCLTYQLTQVECDVTSTDQRWYFHQDDTLRIFHGGAQYCLTSS
jgi:hypothetical protein